MLDLPADCLLRFAEDKRRELRITMVVFLIQFILVRFYMHAEIILLFSPFFSSFPPFLLFLPLFPPFFLPSPPLPRTPQKSGGRGGEFLSQFPAITSYFCIWVSMVIG